ncbi:protein kinase [bacterium]|nr:protein kinase [candidate division CSSED10-310 bacterium]
MNEKVFYPEIIGNYRILGVLGYGGMGTVFNVMNLRTGERAALKTVSVPSSVSINGIRREIECLIECRHPGIIRVHDGGIFQDRPWYIMEYIEGKTLREWISNSVETEEENFLEKFATIFCDICEALAYLHGKGIVHLDVKPENILIRTSGKPVLMDFGLVSRFYGRSGREITQYQIKDIGTLEYMAPEVILGEAIDARADIYSLGCILYEFFSGQVPYSGNSPEEILAKHLNKTCIPLTDLISDFPIVIEDLIKRLLATDPHERWGHAQDVARQILKIGLVKRDSWTSIEHQVYLYRSRFVGRQNHMQMFLLAMDKLKEGRGGLLFVSGETGIGKTRLLLEFAKIAHQKGIQVLSGNADPFLQSDAELFQSASLPLGVFYEPIQTIFDIYRKEKHQLINDQLMSDFYILLPYFPFLENDESFRAVPFKIEHPPEMFLPRLYQCIEDILIFHCRNQPCVLLLDDLQWSDELSIDLLKKLSLSGKLERFPLFITGTFRSEESAPLLESLITNHSYETIYLKRFNDAEIHSIISDMLATPVSFSVFAEFVAEVSEGNPFFIGEYIKTAIERHILIRDENGYWSFHDDIVGDNADFGKMDLPASISDLITSRLEKITETSLRILEVMAAMGREASYALIKSVTEEDEKYLDRCVIELTSDCLIEDSGTDSLRFTHHLIQTVVYKSLSDDSRKNIHRRIAVKLEVSDVVERKDRFKQVAYHYFKCGELASARKYYLIAARRASAKCAYYEAEKLYEQYLNLIAEPDMESLSARIDLSMALYGMRGDNDKGLQELKTVCILAEKSGYKKIEADALSRMAEIFLEKGDIEEGLNLCHQASRIYQTLGEKREQGVNLHRMANISRRRGRLFTAKYLYEQAMGMFNNLEDTRLHARVVTDFSALKLRMSDINKTKQLSEALNCHRMFNDRIYEAFTLELLAEEYIATDQVVFAESCFIKAEDIYREIGSKKGLGRIHVHKGDIAFAAGNIQAASLHYAESFNIFRNFGDKHDEAIVLSRLASIDLYFQEYIGAIEKHKEAAEIFKGIGDLDNQAREYTMIAQMMRDSEMDLMVAENYLRQAEAIQRKLGNIYELIAVLCELGYVNLACDHYPDEEFEEIKRLVDKHQISGNTQISKLVQNLQSAMNTYRFRHQKN